MTAPFEDLRYAFRSLRRSPGFSTVAVLVLALAMGANTAIYSIVEGVLLRPLPFGDPDRLCVLWKTVPSRGIEWDWTSYPAIRDWRERNHAFSDLAFFLRPEGSLVSLTGKDGVEEIQASKVSNNFFEVLKVQPFLGHTFSNAEGPGTSVVLNYGFWRSRFGADRHVLGRSLWLDNKAAVITAVMPPDFEFPDKTAQLWMPVTADSRWPAFERVRVADAFCAIGRLKAGISIAQAQPEMSVIAARLASQYPATDARLGIRALPIIRQVAGRSVRRGLLVAGGSVFLLLLIACSNIASLLIARGSRLRREFAIKAALGAGSARLLWQAASENILLCLGGGLAGLPVAYGCMRALLAYALADLPRSDSVSINGTVLLFTFGVCLLTGMIFGLLPGFQAARNGRHPVLSSGGARTSAGRGANRTLGLLVAAQFALAMTLVTGAGLLVRSFLLLDGAPTGFDASHLLTMSVKLPEARYHDPARARRFLEEAVRRITALPGVRASAAGSAVLGSFREHVPNQNLVVEGQLSPQDFGRHARNAIGDGYFQLMGIPLRAGRYFSPDDLPGSPPVAIVNETMARRLWPGENAIGKRFKEALPGLDAPWLTVCGIAGDAVYNRDGIVVPLFYRPIRQWDVLAVNDLVVRTELDPAALAPAVRKAVESINAAVAHFDVVTVAQRLNSLDRPRQFQTSLVVVFAALALILAALGLYGLMRCSVEQRTKEIGIRMALGAEVGEVVRFILGRNLRWALAGMLVGMAGSAIFSRVLSALLFGITATDPITLAAVSAILAAVMLLASGLPTLRAARIDPASVLRRE